MYTQIYVCVTGSNNYNGIEILRNCTKYDIIFQEYFNNIHIYPRINLKFAAYILIACFRHTIINLIISHWKKNGSDLLNLVMFNRERILMLNVDL